MAATPRDIVRDALRFERPERLPRDLWVLPWAEIHHPGTVAELRRRYPSDFATSEVYYRPSERAKGDPYAAGTSTDAWGCEFRNIQPGLIGEVEKPILARTAKGRITFWGEIDRQHVLVSDDPADGRRAVREVARHLYDPAGGVIAQFEFGAGADPATAMVIFDEWEKVHDG